MLRTREQAEWARKIGIASLYSLRAETRLAGEGSGFDEVVARGGLDPGRIDSATAPGPVTVASSILPERVLLTWMAGPCAPSSGALPCAVRNNFAAPQTVVTGL